MVVCCCLFDALFGSVYLNLEASLGVEKRQCHPEPLVRWLHWSLLASPGASPRTSLAARRPAVVGSPVVAGVVVSHWLDLAETPQM